MTALPFNQQFSFELMRLDRLRARVLLGFFLVGVFYTILGIPFYSGNSEIQLRVRAILIDVMLFNLGIVLFEALYVIYLGRSVRKQKFNVPTYNKTINATLEALSPTILMYFVADYFFYPLESLQSPIGYVYFVFIILSTLRLNVFLSIWTGFISATGYWALSVILLHTVKKGDPLTVAQTEPFVYISKSVLIFLIALASAFVAAQIQKSIVATLKTAEEENKIRNLFGQQISKEIVNEMLANSTQLQSKLMNVCVMFIDIRNFTSMVGNKSPVEIVNYQNAFFSIIIEIVNKHKGIINQFLGDGCMVTFGAPQALENPSENAVKAASEIQEAIKEKILQGYIPVTSIGIGMHVGEAVTGNIGTEIRQQYSITGSVVILAARIEQLNKEFESHILASEEVIKNIKEHPAEPVSIGKVKVKGWDEPLSIYKLA